MEYSHKAKGIVMGHNAGKGNRNIASHIKGLHSSAGHSGNSVSSQMKPTRSVKQPGEPMSVLKKPRATPHVPHKPIGN